jgi:hypothetical protein
MDGIQLQEQQATVRAPHERLKDWAYLGAMLAVLLAIYLHTIYTRQFWFDELSTLFITCTPTLREMFRAIPTDGNPPLYFLLARACLHLPIKVELALRLPALCAFLGAALCVYRFVRRHADIRYSFLAMSLFTAAGESSRHAYDARAYTLMLFFTGSALCCWRRACQSNRCIALTGLAGSVAGAILTHQYGIIYVLTPVMAGEAVRIWHRRRIDLPMLGAAFVSVPLLLLTYPPTLRAQKLLLDAIRRWPVFWAHPRLSDLTHYADMFPLLIPSLVLFVAPPVLLFYAATRRKDTLRASQIQMPIEDIAAATAAALLLPLMLLVTHLGTNYFRPRYGVGSTIGLAILTAMLLARFQATRLTAVLTVYACIISIVSARGVHIVHLQPDALLVSDSSSEPIVVASALEFSPAWWYANPQLRDRLHYLVDLSYPRQHSDILPEYSLALESAYTPMQMEDYHRFTSTHTHFLLYCYGEQRLEWILQRLAAEGWHLERLRSIPNPRMSDDEGPTYREMYEVTRTTG